MQTLSFINQKGGVGKTTSAIEIASRLADKQKKILCIDADPQGNMTYIYGFAPDSIKHGLKDVFDGAISIKQAAVSTNENTDLVPNNILMANADRQYIGINSMRILKKALQDVSLEYDYCIIDSPPTLGIINWNVLIASDYIVVPVNANALSIQGLHALAETISEVKENENPSLSILGVLVTRYNPRTKLAKEALPALETIAADYLSTIVFDSKIRQSVAIEDAQASRHSLINGKKNAGISKDYENLVNEILTIMEDR